MSSFNPLSFFTSPVGLSAIIAWLLAQWVKVPIEFIRTRKINWALLISPGGMPSSHSALMTAVTTAIGLYVGFNSPLFALALAISGIVVYDATGVRRQAGLQAGRINLIVEEVFTNRKWPEEEWVKLVEVIGHSPGEAAAGVGFGIAVAVIVRLLMPPV